MGSTGDGEVAEEHQHKKKKIKPGSFQGLGLSQTTYKAIMKMGYNVPTPIQRKTIPTILEGQDVVAMARTGSGKTAAFLIPICERLAKHSVAVGVRAVVLSPTRELAMQTAKFCRQIGRFSGLRCCLLVGGQAMEAQFEHLASNPDIVIATPGRLMHHILEAELSLSRVEVLVFDEADRLFELGFAEQLQKVMEATPPSRQCLLFSATLPAQLVSFSRSGVKDPAFIRLDVETTLSDSLDLWYLYVRKDEKLAAAVMCLRRLHQDKKTTVMFVATKHHVEFFGELLKSLGLTVAVVYGAMDQDARQEQVARFRHKKARILVTTDVAARGIDIPLLDHVLNYDFPPSAKLFVHRAGRTARAGRSGLAISLVTLEDLPYTVELTTFLGHKLRVADVSGNQEEAMKSTDTPLIGALPPLNLEVENLNMLLQEDGTQIKSLYKSMNASYGLYNKSRPSASKSSVARSKEMLKECGGPIRLQGLIHPAFRDGVDGAANLTPGQLATGSASDMAFIQELRGYRPKAEKVGNVISTSSTRTMEAAKLDFSALSAVKTSAAIEVQGDNITAGGSSSSSDRPRPPKRRRNEEKKTKESPRASLSKPHVSKRARLKMAKEGTSGGTPGKTSNDGDFANWDVKVDGMALGRAADTRKKTDEQFYLSVERDRADEAKENGLAMEQYQMDLLPDDESNIAKAKSVIKWDARKKKYLPTMVSVDGKIVKGQRKNESGHKVKGDGEKSGLYAKWAKATKMRIQKVGELEQSSGHLGRLQASKGRAIEFGEGGKVASVSYGEGDDTGGVGEDGSGTRKPIVKFYGHVEEKYLTHKQKRLMKKRTRQDSVVTGSAKQELKTPLQIQKEKKAKETAQLKQKPHLRKEKAKNAKDARRKLHEERQMKFGARTKSKMLIIEGGRKWKTGSKRVANGYGRSSF